MTDTRSLPAGVTPGTNNRRPSAQCPRCPWVNTAANNNHDAAASLLKHQQREHGGAK